MTTAAANCTHHWLVESPNWEISGRENLGLLLKDSLGATCKRCGTKRNFLINPEDIATKGLLAERREANERRRRNISLN